MRLALGEVVAVRSSLVDPTLETTRRLPHVAPDSIEKGTGRLLDYRTAEADGVTSGKYEFASGDILYSKIRPNLNKVALVNFHGVCSADMYALTVDARQVDSRFVAHLLRSSLFLAYAESMSGRVNIPKMNRAQLLGFSFTFPDLAEQRRIAAILDHADALRAKRRQILAHLDDLAQSIFHNIFSGVEFTNVPAGEVMPQMRNGLSPSTDGGHVADVLTLSAVTTGSFNPLAMKDGLFGHEPGADKRVSSGDFLMCRGNGNPHLVGVGSYSPVDRPDLVFPDTVIAGRVDATKVALPYLHAAWQQPGVRRQIEAAARTTNGTFKVNQKGLAAVVLPVPPMRLQRKFAEHVDAVVTERSAVRTALDADDELFASLQSRAFRGEL